MLNISYPHGEFPSYNVAAVFLDEFRLMVYTPEQTGKLPEFTLFDTSVSQDHPTNFRHFRVPLKYRDWSPSVTLDTCIGLGMQNQDEPLIVDPTQALILLQFYRDDVSTDAVVMLRIQALVKQACLMGADTDIPWRELERDAVVIEPSTSNAKFSVHGVHVIEVTRHPILFDGDVPVRFHVFDFSRRGCSTLRDANDETMGAAWCKGGRGFPFEWSGIRTRNALCSLGNGTFYGLVCGLHRWKVHEG